MSDVEDTIRYISPAAAKKRQTQRDIAKPATNIDKTVAAPTAIIDVLIATAPPPLPPPLVPVDLLLVDVDDPVPVAFDVPLLVVLVPLPPLQLRRLGGYE